MKNGYKNYCVLEERCSKETEDVTAKISRQINVTQLLLLSRDYLSAQSANHTTENDGKCGVLCQGIETAAQACELKKAEIARYLFIIKTTHTPIM